MPALWTYPWTLSRSGLEDACTELDACGVDALNVASHYHSVRSMQPRFPDALFRSYAGGCYFDPDDRFDEIPIEPPVNDVEPWADPLAAIVDGVHDHGLAVNAWTVVLHNTALAAANPEYRFESAFGDVHDHSLCPSHPAVRDYYGAVVGAIVDRGVDEVQLESIGFPSAFHDHGSAHGHDKRQTVTDPLESALLSQCFCDGCRAAADSHSVDFERARTRVRELIAPSLSDPTASLPSHSELADEEPAVDALFDFRASVVGSLVERVASAAGSTPLNYYAMEAYGSDPAGLELAGVRLADLERHLDRVTAICYVRDPETARSRIEVLDELVDLPIDAGVTLDPDVVERAAQFHELVDAIEVTTDGELSVYHHSLATEAHLEWIKTAFAR
ncbi:hypothetical protein [Natrononativus amylolyticus]|uniref:hypothetical protein n=1 Tax=Natrononativus amylolyticus TaxID=2963434 RepID=UPI0020CC0E32|nr:hypothetical protein [Natrononativus amylolyticus]